MKTAPKEKISRHDFNNMLEDNGTRSLVGEITYIFLKNIHVTLPKCVSHTTLLNPHL
jgi:hypothetical protein